MKCPMKMADGSYKDGYDNCHQEDCAWWNKIYGRCVINSLDSIAYAIDIIYKHLNGENPA